MSPIETFLWGFFGSCAIEVVNAHNDLSANPLAITEKYCRPAFWTVRILTATVSGLLAVAYGAETPVSAISVGAATPLIITRLIKDHSCA